MRIRHLFLYSCVVTLAFVACTEPVTEPEAIESAATGDAEAVFEALGVGEIAFASNRQVEPDIYTAMLDGSAPLNLSSHPEYDKEPAWSPDGERLAFISRRSGGDYDIFIMDADAPAVVRQITNNGAMERNPTWSPDGERIAFRSDKSGDFELYVMYVDSSGGWKQLTRNSARDAHPTWAPDGSKIAFTGKRNGNWDIYVMRADGSGEPHRLTHHPAAEGGADWSPDGRKIAFHSNEFGTFDIHVMNADGSGQTRITSGTREDQNPDWSPTGTHVVFSRTFGSNGDIYIVSAEGSTPIQFTHDNNNEIQPSWGPRNIGLVVRSLDNSRSRVGEASGQPYSFAGSPGFAMARDLLAARFPRISFEGVPEVTPETLAGADVFVINQLEQPLTSAEVCALEVFVKHGGALVEARDLENRSAILGTRPGQRMAESTPRIVNPGPPLLSGPFGFVESGLTTGPNFAYSDIGEAVPVTANSAGPNIIEFKAAAGRTGRAVFIGDDEFFMNGDFPGERNGQLKNRRNQTVLLNTFAFLAGAPGLQPGANFSNLSACANRAPTADAGGPYTAAEGSPTIVFDATAADPDGDALTYDWDFGDGTVAADAGPTPSHGYLPDDARYSATLTVTDGGSDGPGVTDEAAVKIENEPPALGELAVASDPVAVGTSVQISAMFMDPGSLDTHTATIDWGDGAATAATVTESDGSGLITAVHSYSVPGVYTVTATLLDDDGGEDRSTFKYVVVYDPDAGFITGGGWIESPAGAYPADPTATGKATFGFVSKYRKGAGEPTGHTTFKLHVVGLSFHASSYDWLVIKGPRARYTGHGSLNGVDGYAFMLSAIDGALVDGGGEDALRIKIWDAATGEVVYDSEIDEPENLYAATELGGGSIVIHRN